MKMGQGAKQITQWSFKYAVLYAQSGEQLPSLENLSDFRFRLLLSNQETMQALTSTPKAIMPAKFIHTALRHVAKQLWEWTLWAQSSLRGGISPSTGTCSPDCAVVYSFVTGFIWVMEMVTSIKRSRPPFSSPTFVCPWYFYLLPHLNGNLKPHTVDSRYLKLSRGTKNSSS